MRLPRHVTTKINYLLDQWVPPILRDASWFMPTLIKILFGAQANHLLTFKERGAHLSTEAFLKTYQEVDPVLYGYVERKTDLHADCIPVITGHLLGSVLEVGAGKGYLANIMTSTHTVTACDLQQPLNWNERYPHIPFVQGTIEHLPFETGSFDTVVCTHTLEHVQHLTLAISELRRVAKRRLIIVVPKQRPYKYTFDLHLHFFPYPFSLLNIMGTQANQQCRDIGGDLFYTEDRAPDSLGG
jgi:SAM-dependent methyltransferase